MQYQHSFWERGRIFFIKCFNKEYWSSSLLYLPVMPYLCWLMIRSRAVFFFNVANPGIKNGGLLMESKWEMYKDAPAHFFPPTYFVGEAASFDVNSQRMWQDFHFPVVAKPAIGSRGMGVAIIRNLQELEVYHQQVPVPYIVQQKITYPLEAGIFYVRMPGQEKGIITGIVQKEFVQVIGNGTDPVIDLLKKNKRYLLQLKDLQKMLDEKTLHLVPTKGEVRILADIGNHARGSHFINAASNITPALTQTIDTLCKQFPGFYFGRIDIRFQTWDALEQGQHFAVIEVNGSGSEPTHIYDPNNSLWYMWKEICTHWRWMFTISQQVHRQQNIPYPSIKEGIQLLRENEAYQKKLKGFVFTPPATSIEQQTFSAGFPQYQQKQQQN